MDEILKITGLLGFLISVATFVLTRWERRASLTFGLDPGTSADFDAGEEIPMDTVNITIANTGARSIHVDLRELEIHHGKHVLLAWREDHFGGDRREVLLKPNDEVSIGIPLATFLRKLEISNSGKHYEEEGFYKMLPLRLTVKSVGGKSFSSKNHKYWEAAGEFHRA